MRHSEHDANRWLAETAATNKRQSTSRNRQRPRGSRARRLLGSVKASDSALGIVARAVGLLLAFGSFIMATAPGGAA